MMPDDHLNAIVDRLRNADNIPYVATMTPIVSELAASMPITSIPTYCGGPLPWVLTSAAT